MDNKVIQVFDYIGEKVGIAIDWTSEAVLPQVTEFMHRYANYEIARSIVFVAMELIIIAAFIFLWRCVYKSYKTKDGFWYYDDEFSIVIVVVSAIVSLAISAFMVDEIIDIIAWSMVPEMKFVEVISELMKK